MSPMRVVILNPCLVVTPLNLRRWLREKLASYEKAGVVTGETVTGLLFLSRQYKGELGTKVLGKIIASATSKRSWLSGVEVITSYLPITDDQAQQFLDEVQSNYRIQSKLMGDDKSHENSLMDNEIADTFLGYGSEAIGREGGMNAFAEPVCVVRKARESDYQETLVGQDHISLGQWFAFGPNSETQEMLFGPAFDDKDAAKLFAENTYQVAFFKIPSDVQTEQMRDQLAS